MVDSWFSKRLMDQLSEIGDGAAALARRGAPQNFAPAVRLISACLKSAMVSMKLRFLYIVG